MSPPEPPRPRGDQAPRGTQSRHSSSRLLSVTEIDATTRPHTPVPPEDARPTAPPPFAPDRRPPPRNLRGSSPGVVVPPLRVPATPTLRDYEEEKTLVGVGPVSEAPSARDSQEISTDSLLAELGAKAEQARRAEARAATAERELNLARAARVDAHREPSARGPTISLGDGRWWFLVITALLGSGGLSALIVKWHELDRPTASQAQVTDVKQDVQESAEQAKKRADAEKADREASDQRARVTAAFLCAQGLRADGLDCDALLQEIEFAPQPLHPRGPLVWKTRARWPPIRDPPDK